MPWDRAKRTLRCTRAGCPAVIMGTSARYAREGARRHGWRLVDAKTEWCYDHAPNRRRNQR